ncbi:MAG: DUF1559 domain-containing protein [Planctomycetaceae bacterium]|jgi:prepilin-type N-terminal cleavage/methylation domain-containing protein|nr:DUF1559 domain-containing protein [Planctomycetaceae bacterium]
MKRSAFTLVELLVVVAIIALLLGILLPAMNMVRETARQNLCISRQRDLAIAFTTYNNEYNGLPGTLNQLGITPIHSWAIAVFPKIGESKRYDVLMKSWSPAESTPADVQQAIVPLPALLCPSNRSRGDAPLNYVVNCGPVEGNDDFIHDLSLFRDRRSPLNLTNSKVKIEEIPDGVSNTILLTENFSGTKVWWKGEWSNNVVWNNWTPLTDPMPPVRDVKDVEQLGFLWSAKADQGYVPNSSASVPRPASKHPGTVIAAYADGTAKAINDDISPNVWLKAVCPDDSKL